MSPGALSPLDGLSNGIGIGNIPLFLRIEECVLTRRSIFVNFLAHQGGAQPSAVSQADWNSRRSASR
jgi:hypothetical protein